MKKIKYFLTAIVLPMLLLSSCKMDTLPTGSLGSSDAFKTPSDMDKAVLTVYDEMLTNDYYNGRMLTAGDFMGDDIRQSLASSSHLNTFYDYGWTKIAANTGVYYKLYYIIAHINDVLDRSKDIADSPAKQAEVANLRALRAVVHFDISKLYAPLPVMLGKGSIPNDVVCVPIMDEAKPIKDTKTMVRQPVTKVYQFIISELEEVLPKLQPGKLKGIFGQDAAKAVLARAYLYKGDYTNAYKYANELITCGSYSLISRNKYISSFGIPYGPESIFELDSSSDDNAGINGMGNYVYASMADPATGYKEMCASAHFAKLLSEDSKDVRLQLFVPAKKIKVEENGQLVEKEIPAQQSLFVAYSDNKTKGTDYFPTNKWPGRDGNSQINNIVVYRLSEMYLIAAESALKNGDTSKAKTLIDELRSNRIKEYDATTSTSITIDDILYERRVELFGEGHRAFDLRRNLMSVVRFTTPEEKDKYRYDGHDAKVPGVIAYDYYRNWLPFVESQLVLFPEDIRDSQQTSGYN